MNNKNKYIGLFFGSFNPIHVGHLIIANYMVEYQDLSEIWFVVTPQNPFKKKASLLNNYNRLEMVRLAINDYPKMKPSSIEFNLPQPNYTIDTLSYLVEKYPNYIFSLLMGQDNIATLDKWKNYIEILKNFPIYVYPRLHNKKKTKFEIGKIHYTKAPIIEISSSLIRKGISSKKNMSHFVTKPVWEFIESGGYYF